MTEHHVKIFSILRDRLGSDSILVSTPTGSTIEKFLDASCDQYPVLLDFRPYLRVALNQEYSDTDDVVESGDDIAFLMPASGG